MDIFRDESEFTDVRMVQRVMDLFECRPGFQKIVRLGLVAGMKCDDEDGTDKSRDRGLSGSHTRSSGSVYPLPLHYYASSREVPCPHSVKVEAKESDFERKARLLEEVKKVKEKAEKKRLKKMKRKEKRRLQKLEREKRNPIKSEEQSKTEGSKRVNDESKINTISSDKQCASAKDTDSSGSSDDESSDEDSDTRNDSGDSEELDMTSTFVSKAALIARRKLEQKPKPEMREKKKTPVKEPKIVPDKPNEDPDVEKKDSATRSSPAFEDNVKISTDLAVIGNRFASAGDFNMAVKYFTDAIKYNPTEFKLFGNRSFCFEKMQEYEKALTDAELSLSMWPGWVKGLFRRGRALAGLKRYEEAGQAFREVLKLDSSYAEAAQELMRVQITQLMEYGFTREQSSNALIIHETVQKALEVLSKLNHRPGSIHSNGTVQPAQVANVTGVSPVLSANTIPAPPKPAFQNKPLGPVQNMSNVHSQPTKTNNMHPPQELFPVWVGNLVYPVTESVIANMFSKVGAVSSVKVLTYKRCAFVNFTKQEHCDEAIRRFHGCELNGMKIAVRYPDRIPQGLGISRSAIKAVDLQDDNMRQSEYSEAWNAVGSRRPFRSYRPVPDYRGNY
ncbi:uncharacterized protein LOC116385516 [Anarrhichthys ocellatus]|uniref:uncharacterized protein LOC116385516 n=1 Tax=Anarrhichthys ocellatus TaxID=433405 RepID=UPI0012ECDB7D|nr:uncharacterized protein LOC116385516 [Anarrhichthys ocellatus]